MTEELVLVHHGIKGQKWGVRRFQNKDGTRTSAGIARYGGNNNGSADNSSRAARHLTNDQKKALKTGVAIAGVVLAAYGGYKLNQAINKRSVITASHVGAVFANQFANDVGAKGIGPGTNPHQRVTAGARSRSYATQASTYFNNQVSDNIAGRRGVGKLRNAANYYKLKSGKATPFDLYDYQRMASESVSKSGAFDRDTYRKLKERAQTSQDKKAYEEWHYAALLIDAVNNGGQIPFKRLDQERSIWVTGN